MIYKTPNYNYPFGYTKFIKKKNKNQIFFNVFLIFPYKRAFFINFGILYPLTNLR